VLKMPVMATMIINAINVTIYASTQHEFSTKKTGGEVPARCY
jgi:hypothetical protein